MTNIIKAPIVKEEIENLKAGDTIYLTGTILTGRDSAHKRLIDILDDGRDLPIDIKDQVIFYVGPTPTPPNRPIGSAGPTTSIRMDAYTPRLLDLGLKGMIGKGERSKEVKDSIIKNRAIYFAATGGAGALISKSIKSSKVIAFDELGTEAIRVLEVVEMPLIVAIDTKGNDLYEIGRSKYKR
ncbi:MAG: Fe-S-containing hydro-lyase [Clostridiales bacterium]|nr:Fe-S-containing hydro-lyase [Clostridiales bacterium]